MKDFYEEWCQRFLVLTTKDGIGQSIKIYGRIQSRTYQKKISENETDLKTAYEVSISKMEVERLQEASGE